jgi:hypothetical protein
MNGHFGMRGATHPVTRPTSQVKTAPLVVIGAILALAVLVGLVAFWQSAA